MYFVIECLLQNATVITKCEDFMTKYDCYCKCDVYYKLVGTIADCVINA